MHHTLFWLLLIFSPAIVVLALGMRAAGSRMDEAWADYSDIFTALEWFAAPMLVVTAPMLVGAGMYSQSRAGVLTALAILLLYLSGGLFTPEKAKGFRNHLTRIVAGSGMGIACAVYMLYVTLAGGVAFLAPSASLYITILWMSYLAHWGLGRLLGGSLEPTMLGPGELFDRIREIAVGSDAELESVSVVKCAPGYSKCVNAVAVEGQHVVIFEDLLQNLDKAEVDAVVEHEIGHIADERLWSLDKSLRYGCNLVLLAVVFTAEKKLRMMPVPSPFLVYSAWFAIWLLPELLSGWYSRKVERRANQNVGHLTDPISVVSGYYKLAILNHLPLSRPWWSRVTSTHPCIDEEISEIAERTGLNQHQLDQALVRAQSEIAVGSGDRYEVPISAQETRNAESESLVSRTGRWSEGGVVVVSLLCGVLLLIVCFMISLRLPQSVEWIPLLVGTVSLIVGLILPLTLYNNARLRRLREAMNEKLTASYGDEIAQKSLLVDVLFPGWSDRKQPWQGAYLHISDGELVLSGEAATHRISLNGTIGLSRWANNDATGSEARMVLICHNGNGCVIPVFIRIFDRPPKGTPANWRQLEKHVRCLLIDAGADVVRARDMMRNSVKEAEAHEPVYVREHELKWSPRVPVAVLVYLVILAIADYICHQTNGGGWWDRAVWFTIATVVSGPGLLSWITRVKKDDDSSEP